ncbi:nuclear transport factor 2 family protein [uncultured Chryseobacterium sp.]|jgi:Ketosteroid isomerase-related protein|uniref:nuclear transport factor 2 family protein n=1 Tax=uncultured Chryseobacterium sp. TaxID=259322 RepID=UPI002617C945|nr:nuclear transport factor 2 family protein [uncultured Chryseobacterium sp.]
MSKNVTIVQSYFNAVAKGDFDTVGSLFADDVVWHQPGNGVQSGTYNGKAELFAHLGNFMKWSDGTFAIDEIEYTTDNGNLVAGDIRKNTHNAPTFEDAAALHQVLSSIEQSASV